MKRKVTQRMIRNVMLPYFFSNILNKINRQPFYLIIKFTRRGSCRGSKKPVTRKEGTVEQLPQNPETSKVRRFFLGGCVLVVAAIRSKVLRFSSNVNPVAEYPAVSYSPAASSTSTSAEAAIGRLYCRMGGVSGHYYGNEHHRRKCKIIILKSVPYRNDRVFTWRWVTI